MNPTAASSESHSHVHGLVEPAVFSTRRGLQAIKWSFLALMATALMQVIVVLFSGSVALLADTIHNVGDAATALPLWIAFRMSQKPASNRFTYGYGRVEDLAGVIIVGIILASAVVAGYQSVYRIYSPQQISHIWAVMGAAVIGFLGNEAVAQYRIKVGRDIGSAALVADGHHARVDGLTSLSVFFGSLGVWLGYPLADPVVGLLITAVILRIVWDSGRSVFIRLLDGIDPAVIEEIRHAAAHIGEVKDVSDVRVRWLGHRMYTEINIAVDPHKSVDQGHTIGLNVQHELLHHLPYLSGITVHVDPSSASGEQHHNIHCHSHGDHPEHSH